MRLVLFDGPPEGRARFNPLALSHPIWELRCGITSQADKITAKVGATDVVGFVPDYMAAAINESGGIKVNDPASLTGDDLFCVKHLIV